jgi:hypothetical protein
VWWHRWTITEANLSTLMLISNLVFEIQLDVIIITRLKCS